MPLEQLGRKLYPPGVPVEIDIPAWRVFDLLKNSVEKYPDKNALLFYQYQRTYSQLWEDVNRFARALQDRGLNPGDRVALMLPNCPQYVVAYYGALLVGGVVTQINPLLVATEVQALLEDSGSRAIIALDGVLPRVQAIRSLTALEIVVGVNLEGKSVTVEGVEDFMALMASVTDPRPFAVEVRSEDPAVLQYTGGTTGRSKGAVLSHRNLVANVLQMHAFNELYPGEERSLAVIPLFHVYGMTVVMNLGVHLGGTMVLLPRFNLSEVLDAIQTQQVTLWPGVPTMYVALLQVPRLDPASVASIRLCNSGSAPMPIDVMYQFEEKTGATILEGYGLTEASPTTHAHASWMPRKPGTVGIALPSTEFRIVDLESHQDLGPGELGELWVRGPQVMKEYWNRPTETSETLVDGGWLRTGDLASCDSEGYLSIVDRLKDLIIASGYNVYPREIEEVLYQHPQVLEAVVVGAPDPYRGETVRAVVVPKPGSNLDDKELTRYLADHLAVYKRPTIIEFRSELPKTAVGKILRRVVRDESPTSLG